MRQFLRSKRQRAAAGILALALAGCANASTDPRSGGLAGGISGLATGAYEQRLADRRDQLDDMDRAEAALAGRVGNAESRLRDVDRRIAERRGALQKLRAELAAIDRDIAEADRSIRAKMTALAATEAANERKGEELARVRAEVEQLKAKRESVQRERDKLASMIKDLEDEDKRIAVAFAAKRGKPIVPAAAPEQQRPPVQPASQPAADPQLADIEQRSREADQRLSAVAAKVQQTRAAAARLKPS
jgi:chromosome segregation ATPase